MREGKGRGGSVLALVLIFSLMFFGALLSYWLIVSTNRADTVGLVKSVQATAIGDGVCAELESIIHRAPWDERFYYVLAQQQVAAGGGDDELSSYSFSHDTYPFFRTDPEYASGDVRFFGIIKDLDAFSKTYRLYLEVIYYDYKLTMSWDKQYAEGLMGSLNHDGTSFNKALSGNTVLDVNATDLLLDELKRLARDPSHADVSAEEAELLRELQESRASGGGRDRLRGLTLDIE